MSRIIAIDFGEKYSGLAWTDNEQRIALPLEGCETSQLIAKIKLLTQNETIETIALGYPLKCNNEATHSTAGVLRLKALLELSFAEIAIELYDERFTTILAKQSLLAMPKSKRNNKHTINVVSATLLLQHYLESKQNNIYR